MGRDRIPRALPWLLTGLGLAILAAGAVRCWPRTVDDAYITFRYAQNLADGRGPVFNPGERVEGYSSPSWLLLSTAVLAAGGDPVTAAKLCGVLASIVLVLWLAADLARAGAGGAARGLAALVLASSPVLQIWSAAGMETNAYALLFFGGLVALARERPAPRDALAASALLAGAALTRPEGLAFWCAGAALALVRGGREARGRRVAAYLVPGLALLAHLLWRWSYYGVPLPNTYYAKTGGGWAMWRQGLEGLGGFVTHPAHVPWLAAAVLGALAGIRAGGGRRTRAAIFAGAIVLHLLYVVSVGDDGLRVHRFYVPVLAPLAALAGLLLAAPADRGRTLVVRAAGIAAVLASVALSLWTLHVRIVPALGGAALAYQEGNVRLGLHLRQTSPAVPLIAATAAGAIPYYSRLPMIDMHGLNDVHIARVPFPRAPGMRLMKWDNAYVLERAPEVIVINRGYFRAGDPLAERVAADPGLLAENALDRDLFARVARDGRYGLHGIRFDDGSVFFVFRRIPGR